MTLIANNQAPEPNEALTLINALRAEEGDSVTLCADNADFGGPNAVIECFGSWTGWETRRIPGNSLLDCLRLAVFARAQFPAKAESPPRTAEPTIGFSNLRQANALRQAEWDPGTQISLSFRGNELAGEVGEACNVIKKLERERMGIRGSRAEPSQLADELADVVICADLIALDEGINLGMAVARKFNATSEKVGLLTRMGVSSDV